ncbi:hypothetical protein EDB89DRAFT_1909003 [Lactarius sanguifluus]|nr:hypothetical protein EDB89DRAFT_1909003 [Lactarius sanguifluus]
MPAEPQSRVVLDGHSNGLIAQYDIHPKVLADHHLSLFRERLSLQLEFPLSHRLLFNGIITKKYSYSPRQIEFPFVELRFCLYSVESFRKLYHKVKVVDASFDSIELNITRVARNKVKDNRGHSDSARGRVKDDLKDSAATYADYVENNTLPKFKRAIFPWPPTRPTVPVKRLVALRKFQVKFPVQLHQPHNLYIVPRTAATL